MDPYSRPTSVVFKSFLNLILKDKIVQYASILVAIKVLALSLCFGLTTGFILIASFFTGFFIFQSAFKNQNEESRNYLSSLIGIIQKTSIVSKTSDHTKTNCSVCGHDTCTRERVVHRKKPWTGLSVPKEVDQAVANLLQKTLDEFVSSWMKDLTSEESFQQELKEIVRHAASVVLARGLKVDVGRLLLTRGLRTVSRHAATMPRFKHPALRSRQAELAYLRALVTALLPLLLTPRRIRCKTFEVFVREVLSGWLLLPLSDAACDPHLINSLLLLLLGLQPFTNYPQRSHQPVEFLAEFVSKPSESDVSALRPDMCTILKDQSLLYTFMQFLKSQGAVYILQFCLDVEEFNRRMLTPELSSEDLDLLYRDAWDLYSVYFSPHSPDTLNFPDDLVTQMRKVLSKDVTKLRTSPPLFQAYEYAYNILDSEYCTQFHTSDDFYAWLCGPKQVSPASSKSRSSSPSLPGSPSKSKVDRSRGSGGESTTVSRLSVHLSKLKGALKQPQVTDGQLYDADSATATFIDTGLETDSDFAEALQYDMDDECGGEMGGGGGEQERDLSAWRVRVAAKPPQTHSAPLYAIDVQRIDCTQGDSSQWTVERRAADFQSLDAKLTEFHGEFPDARLPRPNDKEVEKAYEEYLKRLLSKPALRGSDLLFSFLACAGDFSADDGRALGRLLRRGVPTLPLTLRKERGQHLEPFIAAFVAATDANSKTHHRQSSKVEYTDVSQESSPRRSRNVKSTLYGDNLGLDDLPSPPAEPSKSSPPFPNTPSHLLIYIGINVLSWSRTTARFAIALQKLFGNAIDTVLKFWLNRKLNRILVPERIAHLVNLLQWAIFDGKRGEVSAGERARVARAVESRIREVGRWRGSVYGALYATTQSPLLNKQLFYSLLDELMSELFPELNDIQVTVDDKGVYSSTILYNRE